MHLNLGTRTIPGSFEGQEMWMTRLHLTCDLCLRSRANASILSRPIARMSNAAHFFPVAVISSFYECR